MATPLTVSGTLTLQDPGAGEHRLTGAGSSLFLDVQSFRSLRGLVRGAPAGRLRAAAVSALHRGLAQSDLTLYVRVGGRMAARLSPGAREGVLGRLLGLPGVRLTPLAFLKGRASGPAG